MSIARRRSIEPRVAARRRLHRGRRPRGPVHAAGLPVLDSLRHEPHDRRARIRPGPCLIVSDIQAARAELVRRGVEVSEVFHFAGWNRVAPDGRVSGPAPERRSYGRSCRSATRTATAGCCRRSRRGCPDGSTRARCRSAPRGDLAGAFRRAEAAHGEHEKRTGQRDANWPEWYAAYMVAEQAGTGAADVSVVKESHEPQPTPPTIGERGSAAWSPLRTTSGTSGR